MSVSFTKTYCHPLTEQEKNEYELIWELERTHPFDELILSWNGMRPKKGKWVFWVSLFVDTWSCWIRYAEWGPKLQKTFKYTASGSKVESYQDAVYTNEGLCNAFRIKTTAEGGADLKECHTLFACLSNLSNYSILPPKKSLPSILLANFPRRSQLTLDHPRFLDLCSPTATTSAIHFLLKKRKPPDPLALAKKIHDMEFDIYGNWILNTAEAFHQLKGKFRCHVERLDAFSTLHTYLMKGLPVIASVRGPLTGSFRPLTFGHLLCVIGYDATTQHVLCVDSAFPEDDQTAVSYPLKNFLEAWARRYNITYLFPAAFPDIR
ncbi:MAG TPA: C39 family peptidase [Chlamydiales bacterium]|nr:C39 family peptidase [Chlamydiales bacterium]